MASLADSSPRPAPFAPDRFEQVMAFAAIILLVCVITAITKGAGELMRIDPVVLAHLFTILIALALTPIMLLRRRGDRLHRQLGTIWVMAMIGTAALSFGIRGSQIGGFSFIHILSVWTLIQVPMIWWSARRHNVKRHRQSVRGMVFGALLIAGFFTFPFDRTLGRWLFG